MFPIPRAVAICQGGPLDGRRFSVVLGEDAKPPALEVQYGDGTLVYAPRTKLELADELAASLEVQQQLRTDVADDADKHPVFQGFELYLPDEDGTVQGHDFHGVYLYELTK